MDKQDIFEPGIQVDAGFAQIIVENIKTGRKIPLPPLSCLFWEEDGRRFIHCLELDLLSDGATEKEAADILKGIVFDQMRSAKEDHAELSHPAPQAYWDKFFEIHRNQVLQAFLDAAPNGSSIKVRELALTHAQ